MSSTVLLVALAHAVGVLLVAAVSRSRGWTLLATIAALLLAVRWGHPQDVAEKWVAIGLSYWACWRMLPRRKSPRPARHGRSARTTAQGSMVAGLGSVALMVTMLAIVAAVPRRVETQPARVSAMTMQRISAGSPAAVTQKTSKVPVGSTW